MQALWMLLASLFFASMGVCIKFASAHFNSFEIVTYRGMVGVVFLCGPRSSVWALSADARRGTRCACS